MATQHEAHIQRLENVTIGAATNPIKIPIANIVVVWEKDKRGVAYNYRVELRNHYNQTCHKLRDSFPTFTPANAAARFMAAQLIQRAKTDNRTNNNALRFSKNHTSGRRTSSYQRPR